MNATNTLRRVARPFGALLLLGALVLVLPGCDRHRRTIRYHHQDSFHRDVRVHRAPPVVVHRRRHVPPPVVRHSPPHRPWRRGRCR